MSANAPFTFEIDLKKARETSRYFLWMIKKGKGRTSLSRLG
jgi:hypothetical protein